MTHIVRGGEKNGKREEIVFGWEKGRTCKRKGKEGMSGRIKVYFKKECI